MSALVAVVLAAGRGKRMKSRLPKVLHAAAGRPLVHYPIAAALAANAERVVVVVSPDTSEAIGSHLAAAFSAWLADRAGRLSRPLTALLDTGRVDHLVPLGVVAGLFAGHNPDAKALGVFLGRFGLTGLDPDDLDAWHTAARGLVTNALSAPPKT